jgi:putative ABC transport system substrate-binding protein
VYGREIDAAFDTLVREGTQALFVDPEPLFADQRIQLVHLASRHTIPATYGLRVFAEAGGLMSYGASAADAFRQVGIYVGRILLLGSWAERIGTIGDRPYAPYAPLLR